MVLLASRIGAGGPQGLKTRRYQVTGCTRCTMPAAFPMRGVAAMTVLSGNIAALLLGGVVEEGQVQPAGIDLRVGEIHAFTGEGVLGVSERRVAETRPVETNEEGWWRLSPGVYKIVFLDEVWVPSSAVGLCFPRSSLLRSGVFLGCAVWDPGYRGRGEAMLLVANPHGFRLQRGARVAQLIYVAMGAGSGMVYRGAYQGERLSRSRSPSSS